MQGSNSKRNLPFYAKPFFVIILCMILVGLILIGSYLFIPKEGRAASTDILTTKVMDTATREQFEESYMRFQALGEDETFGFFAAKQPERIHLLDRYYRTVLTQDYGGLFQVHATAYFLDAAYQNCVLLYLDWSGTTSIPVQVRPMHVAGIDLGEKSDTTDGYLMFARYSVGIETNGLSAGELSSLRVLTLDGEPFFTEHAFGLSGVGELQLLIAPQPFS